MATRARIAYRYSDGSYISSYHHWDGYLRGLGLMLTENYTDPKIVELSIQKGNASVWYEDSALNDYYHAEPCSVHLSTQELLDSAFEAGEEFLYVYSEKLGGWKYCTNAQGEFVRISKESILPEED